MDEQKFASIEKILILLLFFFFVTSVITTAVYAAGLSHGDMDTDSPSVVRTPFGISSDSHRPMHTDSHSKLYSTKDK
jgi:hypothetical protein